MRRRTWLFALVPLVFCAAPACAQRINLGWNDCPSGASYALTERFACDTNAGVHTLVGSFVAPAGITAMSANEVVIDMVTASAALEQTGVANSDFECLVESSARGLIFSARVQGPGVSVERRDILPAGDFSARNSQR